ncbi:MAG: hypothetical protein RLZZ194_726 [Actinomycetota bacterium]
MDGGTGSFGLCVDKCIEHLFEKKYIEGVRHGRVDSDLACRREAGITQLLDVRNEVSCSEEARIRI